MIRAGRSWATLAAAAQTRESVLSARSVLFLGNAPVNGWQKGFEIPCWQGWAYLAHLHNGGKQRPLLGLRSVMEQWSIHGFQACMKTLVALVHVLTPSTRFVHPVRLLHEWPYNLTAAPLGPTQRCLLNIPFLDLLTFWFAAACLALDQLTKHALSF